MHQIKDFYRVVLSSTLLFFTLSILVIAGPVDDLQNTINSNAANKVTTTLSKDYDGFVNSGNLLPGDYSRLGSFVVMPSNTIIEGSGYNLKNVSLIAVNASNISINNTVFKDTVYPYTKSNTFSPININGIGNNITISNCSFSNLRAGSAGIYLQPIALSDIVLKDISINDTDNPGIATMSNNNTSAINNVIYSNISVSHCGYNSQADDWVVGILLGEIIEQPTHDWRQLHLSNITVENCSAEYSWESGFHLEPNINTNNITIKNCVSSHNGVKPFPSFGAGFVTASAATLLNNVATSNYIGYWFYNGIKVTDQTDDFVYNVENCTDIDSVTEGTHAHGYTTAYANSQLNFTNCLSKNAGSFGFYGYELFNLHLTNETIENPHGDGNDSVWFSRLHNSTINMNYTNNDTFSSNGVWVGLSDNVNISGNYYHIGDTALHLQWNDQKINTINITDANISATQHAIWISDMGANATTNISNITVTGECSGKKVMYDGTAAGVVNVGKVSTGVALSDYCFSYLILVAIITLYIIKRLN